jgi:hypothetical protein
MATGLDILCGFVIENDWRGNPMLELVTPETYIRAETDRSFGNIIQLNGGAINTFYHFREPTPLDKQTVVRMNKDTLYSGAIVDTSGGATVTLPQVPDGRYMSILLVDNDHYSPEVFYDPGVYELPKDTKYLGVFVRTQLIHPDDPAEIALVNKLQDQVVITAKSADPIPASKWEPASVKALTAQYEKDSLQYGSWKGMMGPRGKVDEKTRHIAARRPGVSFPNGTRPTSITKERAIRMATRRPLIPYRKIRPSGPSQSMAPTVT